MPTPQGRGCCVVFTALSRARRIVTGMHSINSFELMSEYMRTNRFRLIEQFLKVHRTGNWQNQGLQGHGHVAFPASHNDICLRELATRHREVKSSNARSVVPLFER